MKPDIVLSINRTQMRDECIQVRDVISEDSITESTDSESSSEGELELISASVNRPILHSFTSTHIRQLVSPFYKDRDGKRGPQNKPSIASELSKKSIMSDASKKCVRRISKAKERQIIERLTMPTQCMLIRKALLFNIDTKKKSPIEYDNREFLCQVCKKRNENH